MQDLSLAQDLTLAVVQFDPIWEDCNANLKKLEGMISDVEADLIILPEMFSTGFTMNAAELAEEMNGKTIEWMLSIAEKKHCSLAGSIIIEEEGKYYNRLIWTNPFGIYKTYDKAHLFRMGKENLVYEKGTERNLMLCKGWSICPLICYDLRFPVWSRNFSFPQNHEYDLLVYVASWPQKRSEHWKQLLKARAIENQCYVAGVNRVGIDGKGTQHSGDSCIIDFNGKLLISYEEKESVLIATLSKAQLNTYREKFPAWMDADAFNLTKNSPIKI